ncbi:unnamed protein product [Haemonchus placei]|uniref:Transposase n=1 Tax=Haemonchus placei TaxID=6290 RepID=A0A0N4VYJ2_HAEPC|nr:unnamed protein product [Haemonchus placei]
MDENLDELFSDSETKFEDADHESQAGVLVLDSADSFDSDPYWSRKARNLKVP